MMFVLVFGVDGRLLILDLLGMMRIRNGQRKVMRVYIMRRLRFCLMLVRFIVVLGLVKV